MADKHAPRKLESRRIALRRAGSGAALLLIAGLTGCNSPGTDTANPPLNVNDSTTMTAAPTPSTSTGSEPTGLPPMTRFRIGYPEGPVQDCTVDGVAVTCALSVLGPSSVESYTGTVTGTLSGLTLTGTSTTHQRFRDEADSACILEIDKSEPVDYLFGLDGTVTMHGGPADVRTTRSGSCSGTETSTDWRWEDSAPWSATG